MSSDKHHLQGRGGGFGNYEGLTLDEVSERFGQCAAEPSMRSASATLRITREQIMARGQLSIYPRLALGFAAAGVLCWIVGPYLPPDLRSSAPKAAVGLFVLSAVLAYGAFSSNQHRRASVTQEREIYRMSAETLDTILAVPFPRKPLTREQRDTLRDLIKRFPEKAALKTFLQEGSEES